ncbi:WxcM-like domain-containing protein [Patescibacteria group bacterium]|nr:WxcM-like domain-containing protein [Patescibacteria group bacterium]
MNLHIKDAFKYQDDRGDLVVFLQSKDLPKSKRIFGQIYFVTFKGKNVVRGNHYHKNWHEWFGVVDGVLEVTLEDVKTKKRKQFIINGCDNKYQRIYVASNTAHTFRSLSNYASLLNYSDKEWSPEDTFRYDLISKKR